MTGVALVALVATASTIGCSADPGDALKGQAGVSSAEAGGSSSGISDDAGYGDATTSSSSSGVGTSSGSSSGVASSSSSGVTSSASSSSSGSSSGGIDAPVVPPCTTCVIELRYQTPTTGTTQDIRPHFEIFNNGTGVQSLAELTVRYYFTADGSQSQGFSCDYAMIGCGMIQGTFAAMSTPTATADHYLEISFTGGTIGAGANTGDIQPRFHDSGYQVMFTQSNDYSYDGAATSSFVDNMAMTVYRNGTLVWGTEPGGASASQDAGGQGQDAAQDSAAD